MGWLIKLQSHCASNIISNSHPFHSMWMAPPIPEIRHFQNFPLKIRGQGHGWRPHSRYRQHPINSYSFRSVSMSPRIPILYWLTSLSFHVNRPCHSWDTTFSKFDLENPRSESNDHGVAQLLYIAIKKNPRSESNDHGVAQLLYIAIKKIDLENPRSRSWLRWTLKVTIWVQQSLKLTSLSTYRPCQSTITFLRYSIFKIWPWKSKVKVMGEVNVESHNMCSTFYRLTSPLFHDNRPSHFWNTTFSKFNLENLRSRSWLRWTLKVTPSTHIPFIPC